VFLRDHVVQRNPRVRARTIKKPEGKACFDFLRKWDGRSGVRASSAGDYLRRRDASSPPRERKFQKYRIGYDRRQLQATSWERCGLRKTRYDNVPRPGAEKKWFMVEMAINS